MNVATLLAANEALSWGWQKCCVASKAYCVQLMLAANPAVRYTVNGVSNISGPRRYDVVLYSDVAFGMLHEAEAAVCSATAAELPTKTWWLLCPANLAAENHPLSPDVDE